MTRKFNIAMLTVIVLLLWSSHSHSECYWTLDATFWGDAKGDATVLIHCNDGTGVVSAASNHGTYANIPIDASGNEKSVTMSGSGTYGRVSYNGVAKGKKEGDQYTGAWEVELVRDDGRARTYSGKWKGKGNYTNICKTDTYK